MHINSHGWLNDLHHNNLALVLTDYWCKLFWSTIIRQLPIMGKCTALNDGPSCNDLYTSTQGVLTIYDKPALLY